MPTQYYFTSEWVGDQLRPDWRQVVSEYINAPGGGGAIAKQVSSTITWGYTFGAGVELGINDFSSLNASVGGNYSESKTFSETYTFNLQAGEKARIIYIPNIRFMNGWLKKVIGGDYPAIPSPIPTPGPETVEFENQYVQLHFPIEGGHFSLEFDVPTFYPDSQFKGTAIGLPKGGHDWGQIPNDSISSLRVPEGYTVTLFKDTHFQGESITFGPGDHRYIGDNFNDQTSSISIW